MNLRAALAVSLIASLTFSACALAADPPAPKFEHQEIDKIQIGYGLVIGDVDGDKKQDILLADAKQIVWYANPGKAGEAWKKHIIAEKLTALDNVCIAARDIDGDGKVEVAVGAMWNPGETNDDTKSGAVFYLIRPQDPTQKWEAVKLHHEVTTHRMRWVDIGDGKFQLVVVPLHGKGNKNEAGDGVKILAYNVPADPQGEWTTTLVNDELHATHNFEVMDIPGRPGEVRPMAGLLLGGKEGLRFAMMDGGQWKSEPSKVQDFFKNPIGEVRGQVATGPEDMNYIATIEPMHGNSVVLYYGYNREPEPKRRVLDDTFNQGHALALADVVGAGHPQVIAGWRNPNKEVKVGIKIYVPHDAAYEKFDVHVLDDKMACEDLQVADLDGDGKLDIIAAGRATKNLKVYWNRTAKRAAE
ncbi:MAG: VCBS repeat-containing protein [Phycisphaeraceae bacterium]